MDTEPSPSPPRYSLDQTLARFDALIARLAAAEPVSGPVIVQEPLAEQDAAEQAPADAELILEPAVDEAPEYAATKPLLARIPAAPARDFSSNEVVLSVRSLVKSFGDTVAVDGIDLTVRAGTIFGIVGPNGAGKTTTLSMMTGLLRPDSGDIHLAGEDVWGKSGAAKLGMGILPDRLMLFDRLTGRQLLHYSGLLRGLDAATAKKRTADLLATFEIGDAGDRLVTDYSAGMTKKIALAAAMIHAPRVLVLDEPFESVDSVSSERIIAILKKFVAAGGTVVVSSHSMDLIERICDYVAVFVDGRILSAGTTAEVQGDLTLEERFVDLVNASNAGEDLEWLRSLSD